jgi:hypothetical protein
MLDRIPELDEPLDDEPLDDEPPEDEPLDVLAESAAAWSDTPAL